MDGDRRVKPIKLTREHVIAFTRFNAAQERARREYEIQKLQAAGKCIECGIRKRDSRWLRCWACRKGLGKPRGGAA